MDKLIATQGISKKTLYQLFDSKEDLVQQAIRSRLARLEQACIYATKRADNAVQLLTLLMRWVGRQRCRLCSRMLPDLERCYPVGWQLLQAFRNDFVLSQLSQNLRWGMAEGLFWPELDVDVLARLQLTRLEIVFDHDLYPPTQFAAAHVGQAFDEHFMLGITTPHGQQLYQKYHRL